MMQIQERTPHHIELAATGTIGEQDYTTLANAIAEASPKQNVVLDFTSAEAVDGKGALTALKKFAKERDKIDVDRIAFIGEQKWIDWATRAVSPIVNSDLKAFGQRGSALLWADGIQPGNVEGEGNRTADEAYREAQTEFAHSGRVEPNARAAATARTMNRAELDAAEAKARSKGE